MKLQGVGTRMLDHLLLQRDIMMEWVTEVSREEKPHEVRKKYVMPEGYLEGDKDHQGAGEQIEKCWERTRGIG